MASDSKKRAVAAKTGLYILVIAIIVVLANVMSATNFFRLGQSVAQGEVHVCPRIAVGYGKHVESIDKIDVVLE